MSTVSDFISSLVIWVPIALFFFGILTTQTYFYFIEYGNDSMIFKIPVGIVWMMECLHSALLIHFLYNYAAKDFADPMLVGVIVWSAGATILLEILIVGVAQSVLIYRAWIFNNRQWIVAAIPGVLLTARVGFGLATSSYLLIYDTWPAFNAARGPKVTVNAGLALGVMVDLTTSSLLIHQMYVSRQQTDNARSKNIVDTLMSYAIATGAVTVLFSTAVLVTYNAEPSSLTYACLVEVLSKLYANTLLANLNARRHLRKSGGNSAVVYESIDLPATHSRNSGRKTIPGILSPRTAHRQPVEILKQSTTITDRDISEPDISGDLGSTKRQSFPPV